MKDEMSGAGLIFNSRTLSLRLQFTIIIIKKSSRASNSTAPNTVQVKAEQSTPCLSSQWLCSRELHTTQVFGHICLTLHLYELPI